MVEGLAEKVKVWLKRFDESVDETDKCYSRLERGGKYDPGTPYMLKYEIGYALDHLKSNGVSVPGLEQEHKRICGKLQALEGKRGKDYRVKLCAELLMDVDLYPLNDGLFKMTPVDVEAWNDLDCRDFIEILLMELSKDFDLHAVEERVHILDKRSTANIRGENCRLSSALRIDRAVLLS